MKTPVIISKLEPLKPTCKLDEILLATNRGMIETKVKNNAEKIKKCSYQNVHLPMSNCRFNIQENDVII